MTSTASDFLRFVLLLSALQSGSCWPNGAPFKTCINRFPKHHGGNQQLSPAPYIIDVNQTTYSPSQVLQVTLRSAEDKAATTFRGFQIGARLKTLNEDDEVDEIVGEWVGFDNTTTRLQYWYPEKRGMRNCATHLNNTDKTEVVLLWKAPDRDVGNIIFKSGFVKDVDTFWSSVESPVVQSDLAQGSQPTPRPKPPAPPAFSTDECGSSKGCFLYPPHCSDYGCQYAVTYQNLGVDKNSVRFEMIGGTNAYVSFALSADEFMGEDETVTCISTNSKSSIQHGYNPAQNNEQHRNLDLSDKSVARVDGRIFCSFTRPFSASLTQIIDDRLNGYKNVVDAVKTFNLSQQFFIQMAWGDLYTGSTVVGKHVVSPLVSPRKVDLLRNYQDVVFGVGLPAYLKAHAILGFFAWFFLTGCAMIIARHYRQILNQKLGGIALWFQLHRAAMFAVFVVTAVTIIVIFASLGKWSQRATNHAIVGLTTTGLSLIQIVIGMLRPGLDSKRRPLFNYVHRTVAVVAQILAVATLILGAQIALLPVDLRYNLTVIIVVSVSALLLYEVVLECLGIFVNVRTVKASAPEDDNRMQMESEKKPTKTDGVRVVRIVVFALFCATSVVCLIVFSVYIGVA